MTRLSAIVLMAGAVSTATLPAWAQAMIPMRGKIRSYTDKFAVRVFPMNPYRHRIRVEVKVYDERFRPIDAVVMPRAAQIAPNDNRSFLVTVPFAGMQQRRVRICTESIPFPNQTTQVRTQVCGRFLAYR